MRMIELFDDFLVMFHLLLETFSIFIDWIGEVFMQIGLVIVVLRGYLRHLWVSEIFQCHTFCECIEWKFATKQKTM